MSYEHDDIQARLAALADGTLPAGGRERIVARVQGSPELRDELEAQRRAVAIVRHVEEVPAPASLQRSIDALAAGRSARRGSAVRPRLVAAAMLAAVAAAALIVALTAGPEPIEGRPAPTVLQASRLALSPALLPSPAESPRDRGRLVDSVEGISYPYWRGRFGWRTAGARTDRLGGRSITTVFYADGASRRIGYSIVAGRPLALPGGAVVSHRGVRYHVLGAAGVTVVTWRQAGHTCILAARGVNGATLVHLATWQ
jgi:hypothetical protein